MNNHFPINYTRSYCKRVKKIAIKDFSSSEMFFLYQKLWNLRKLTQRNFEIDPVKSDPREIVTVRGLEEPQNLISWKIQFL